MARTALTVRTPDRDGQAAEPDPANVDGNSFPLTGHEVLLIANTDVAAHTASVAITDTLDGQAVPPKAIPVAAGATVLAGPWTNAYQQEDGTVHVDWDAPTGVEVTCIRVL